MKLTNDQRLELDTIRSVLERTIQRIRDVRGTNTKRNDLWLAQRHASEAIYDIQNALKSGKTTS